MPNPDDLPGLKLWLEGDTITGLSDGAAVATWPDGSAEGNDGTQATGGNRPVWKAAIVNGHPVVRFDGVDDFVSFPDFLTGLTSGEVYLVVRLDADPPASTESSGLWYFSNASGTTSLFPWSGDGTIYATFGSTLRRAIGNPTPSLASWRLFHIVSSASEWTARLDGATLLTTGTNTVEWATAPKLGVSLTNEALDGDVAALLIYSPPLSAPDRADVEAYLGYKYDLAYEYTPPEGGDPPATPTGLAAVTKVTLSWSAAADATGYKLRRTDDAGTTTVYDGALLTYTDTPDAESAPTYTVSAYNGDGESAESAPVTPDNLVEPGGGGGGLFANTMNGGFL